MSDKGLLRDYFGKHAGRFSALLRCCRLSYARVTKPPAALQNKKSAQASDARLTPQQILEPFNLVPRDQQGSECSIRRPGLPCC